MHFLANFEIFQVIDSNCYSPDQNYRPTIITIQTLYLLIVWSCTLLRTLLWGLSYWSVLVLFIIGHY